MKNIRSLINPDNLKWVLLFLGVVGFVLWSWYKKYKSQFSANDARNDVSKVFVTINTTETAMRLHDCFWGGSAITEDEETFCNILKTVPRSVVPEIAIRYNVIDGHNIYSDAIKYLSKSQYESIQNILI